MKRMITADFKEYNANANQNHTSDCVARSISLAYNMDYTDTVNELNRIKRRISAESYRNISAVRKALNQFGYIDHHKFEDDFMSVQEFCDANTSGVFLLLVSKRSQNEPHHMCCILNGDVYDTWDSTDCIIYEVYTVKGEAILEVVELEEVANFVIEKLDAYISKRVQSKLPFADVQLDESYKYNDNAWCLEYIVTGNDKLHDYINVGNPKLYQDYKDFYITLSPTESFEESVERNFKHLAVKIRDFVYYYRKYIEDAKKKKETVKHKNFEGDKGLLIKLPNWCRPYVTFCEDIGDTNHYHERYQVRIEDLNGHYIFLEDDYLKGLIEQINEYKYEFVA